MKITRQFTQPNADPFASVKWVKRSSRITNPDGSVVFQMDDAEVPETWSQLATDIMVSKYFRKAGVPQLDADGKPRLDDGGKPITGPERSARQVIHRLAGCWRHWGEKHGYFDSKSDAQAFYDELVHMMVHQHAAPNSPQWFNTGLAWAYGLSGPAQGHYVPDPKTGKVHLARDAYTHPQPHACFIQSVTDDLVNEGGIMDLWVREARLFKYGSGTGTNFSHLRAENESLSGGGKSSGLMSWLKIGDRAAGAIKSGGTTRRAAKMVCLDMDHPDIERFINWKVREELKVAAMVEGMKHLPEHLRQDAQKLKLKLDYDFNGEAYSTVSGQNSNNSVRIPDAFFETLDADGQWKTQWRTSGKIARTFNARDLWDQIGYAAWRCADPGVQYDSTINAWHTCPSGGRINASNPCVTGDTLVATTSGLRRIKDLVGRTVEVINGRGQRVWVDRIFQTGTKPVYELKTRSGYTLKLTADHRVQTANRGDVAACELTVDDVLMLEKHGFGIDFVPAELGELIGAAVGDGCITHQPNQDFLYVSLAGEEDQVAQRLRGHIDWCKHWLTTGDARGTRPTTVVKTGTGLRVGTSVQAVVDRLAKYAVLDEGSEHKRFADEVLTLDRASQAAILRGLFTTDGTVADYGEKSQYISLDSTSLALLRQVQLILLGFGIKAKLYENRRALGSDSALLPDGKGGSAEYPVQQMHSLRISRASRVLFEREVGFLPESAKAARLAEVNRRVSAYAERMTDRVASLTPAGVEDVFDLTEPVSSHFVANGLVVHNCSEYMFLDNTACNLASINVLKYYDPKAHSFDWSAFEHAIDLWTVVLEISVLMASYPSREVAELSWKYRTLGLGYANLGAMLMQAGIAYDSDEARAVGACLSSILTGRSYRQSAVMAQQLGAFPGYDPDKQNMLRVIRNHRRAARGVARDALEYEALKIRPVPIDHALVKSGRINIANSPELLKRATLAWDEALSLGEKHGFRNAQVTVIAPTGCLVAGSLITTDRGLMRLDRLGNVFGDRWQDVDFAVMTDQGERPATKFFVNGAELTRRISTSCGYTIQGTLRHRIRVVDVTTGRWRWKHFADIQAGDVVPLSMGQFAGQPRPVRLPPLGEEYWTGDFTTRVPRTVTPDLAEFVGYFMGDGSLHAKGLRLCVSEQDGDVVDRLCQLAKSLFNVDAKVSVQKGYREVALHSVPLTMWWEACGFAKRHPSEDHRGKGYCPRIPDAILASNDPAVYSAFLRGLFEADGTVHQGVPMFSSANIDFAVEVKSLLLQLGFPTSSKVDVSGWGQSDLHVVRLRNKSYVVPFAERIGLIGQRKRAALEPADQEQAARRDYVFLPPDVVEELVPVGSELSNAVALAMKRHRGAITRRAAEKLLEQTGDPRVAHALRFFYDEVESNEDGGEQLTYDISVPDNVTYIANGFVSHNTIGLLMDCDTTGIEPDFALVKFKKLAGGGYFKIANASVKPALEALGYTPEQIRDMLIYLLGALTLDVPMPDPDGSTPEGAITFAQWLQAKGLIAEDLAAINDTLPSVFELGFAFSAWSMSEEALKRLGIDPDAARNDSKFNLLRRLGLTKKQITTLNDLICGTQTVEGAPHLKPEHLPVFDCANTCGKYGKRFIHPHGHIRMMAAAQPFITGAISKTINLPNSASVDDIKSCYRLSWELGLKANALYRDGSKLSQPLSSTSDADQDEEEETSSGCITDEQKAREELGKGPAATAPATTAPAVAAHGSTEQPQEVRIINRPMRRRLPDTRASITHKFNIGGHEGYLTVGLYEDGLPGELFITMAKEGSTIGGLMDSLGTAVSVALQYGVPIQSLVNKFTHQRFEPAGMTLNRDIPFAKSLVDYIFRWMGMEFIPGYREANAPKRSNPNPDSSTTPPTPHPSDHEDSVTEVNQWTTSPAAPPSTSAGHPERATMPPPLAPHNGAQSGRPHPAAAAMTAGLRSTPAGSGAPESTVLISRHTASSFLEEHVQIAQAGATGVGALSLAMQNAMGDAPACDSCGAITVRSGTCYKCLNCGNSMGCS